MHFIFIIIIFFQAPGAQPFHLRLQPTLAGRVSSYASDWDFRCPLRGARSYEPKETDRDRLYQVQMPRSVSWEYWDSVLSGFWDSVFRIYWDEYNKWIQILHNEYTEIQYHKYTKTGLCECMIQSEKNAFMTFIFLFYYLDIIWNFINTCWLFKKNVWCNNKDITIWMHQIWIIVTLISLN